MQDDINLVNIVQTLQKIKASLAYLIGDDKVKMENIKKIYFENATLHSDEEKIRRQK